jgi:hypothetical protein
MKKRLAYLMAIALAAFPAAAQAQSVDLFYDDGEFEASTHIISPAIPPPSVPPAPLAPAVQFDVTGKGVYTLDSVSFYLLQMPEVSPGAPPPFVFAEPVPQVYPVTVQIWNQGPGDTWVPGASIDTSIEVGAEGWYDLLLTEDTKVNFTGSIRIGIFLQEGPPPDPPLNLGVDSASSMPFDHSYGYDSTVAPPVWIPADGNPTLDAANYGIRAAVLAPALTCQGFLPPFDSSLTLKSGGRNIPLKAFLFDDAGVPVTRGLLISPPLVQLLYASAAGQEPVDVSDRVAPPGRSNTGQAFRSTLGNMWMYNLKTGKSLPSGTYTVLIGSGDVTEYVVDPTCKETFEIEAPMQVKSHPPKGPKQNGRP